jgi:hypothetical protein
MKKALNIKLGCKSCDSDPLLDNEWINDKGFNVVLPKNKITSIIGAKQKKQKSSKVVSLF